MMCHGTKDDTISEAEAIKRIKAHIQQGDKAKDKADQHYRSAGLLLKELRDNCSSKTSWEALIKSKCGIGASRAYELIAIADGRKTVADVRLANTKRKQKERSVRDVTDKSKAAEPTSPVGRCSYCKKREAQLIADDSGRGLPPGYACDECLKEAEEAFPAIAKYDEVEPKVEPTAAEPESEEPCRRDHCTRCGGTGEIEVMTIEVGALNDDKYLRDLLATWSADIRRRALAILKEDAGRAPPAPATDTDDYPDLPASLNRALWGAAA
jgi:hypothetical protein